MAMETTQLLLLLTAWQVEQPEPHNLSLVKTVLQLAAGKESWTNTPIFMSGGGQQEQVNQLVSWLHNNLSTAIYVFDNNEVHLDKYNPLRNHITDNTLSLLFCQSGGDHIWWLMDRHLRRLRQSRIIVHVAGQRNEHILREIFLKLWSLQFLRVLVLHGGRVYRYAPYPTPRHYQVQLRPGQRPVPLLFPGVPQDLQGYVVSTPAENDLPRVFRVRDSRTSALVVRGYGYRILAEFLKRHNAQLHVSNRDQVLSKDTSVNMSRIIKMIGDHRLEISMHPYVGIDREQGILSYPLHIAQNCLIMPVRNEIPRFMYLLRPFHWSSWLLLLAAVFYISLILYWVFPVLGANTWLRVTNSLLEALCQLLFIAPPSRIYTPSIRYFLVALQIAVLGFTVTNWYSNQLGSYLTATLRGEQVDTFEQLIAQQQHILSKHHEVEMVLQMVPPHLEKEVARLMVGSEAGEQVRALLTFNTSYAYPFTAERWQFFALQQQYAAKPIFRYSSVCLGAPVIAYPMRKDSHLESPLKHFIMRIQSIGLFQHWTVSDFNDALKADYVHFIDNSSEFKPLDLDSLRLGWYILLCGWLLAGVVFLYERHHSTTWH